ncbi:Predicted cell-wall-anchored protein SasA (LPXTG motif) [hydrothermal vent metagenome]|uniref:Predicted cell-wall-anchored protein SasA (LPXTG motif) n=1 Tax=hydrothermal vent metagenome TaxID=652676 RepID=A0A1W1D5H4_9ZZZZ
MNYKKSLVSFAAAMALSTTNVIADTAAIYVPLTTATHDASWVMFGVNGFSNGDPTTASSGTSDFSAGLTALEDTITSDDNATSGLTVSGGDLASLQALAESGLTGLKIGMDITNLTYEPTEPVRTMYVKVGSTSSPNMKFNYKASLEGHQMEIVINNSSTTKYVVTVSQESTYANAVTAQVGSISSASSTPDRTAINDVLDYNLTDNPVNAQEWDAKLHASDANEITNAKNATFYYFDSVAQEWKVWDKRNGANANDFTAFQKGRAYWGRVDINDAVPTNNAGGAAGLVLGKSQDTDGIPNANVYEDENNASYLTEGWNMIAFDDIKPDIRSAATGLVVEKLASGDKITVYDDSGINSVTVTLADANAENNWSKQINSTIEDGVLLGTLPETFKVKVFPDANATANDGTLVFISDKKFSISGTTADANSKVTTLTGANPYVNGQRQAVDDLTGTKVSSAYGEYAVIADLFVKNMADGADTAGKLDSTATHGGYTNVSAKIIFGDIDGDNPALALTYDTDAEPNATSVKTQIEKDPLFDGTDGVGRVIELDIDGDGDLDKAIIASTKPFYIKDATYTRVYSVDSSHANGVLEYTVSNTNSASFAPANGDTASDFASAIQTKADNDANTDTGVYAEADSNGKLVVVATNNNKFELLDTEDGTADFFKGSSSSDTVAKGAVGGVYSLSSVARLPLKQSTQVWTGWSTTWDANDGTKIDVDNDGTYEQTISIADASGAATEDENRTFFDDLVNALNVQMKQKGIHGFASHDFPTDSNVNFADVNVTIKGLDVLDVNASSTGTGIISDTNTTDLTRKVAKDIDIANGDLVADLKDNAIYTPNYANYGPLYTMRDAGYEVEAILRPTTNMVDSSIAWDSIDLTRDENDWFKQNEFNLFNVSLKSGYWVKLRTASASSVTIGTPTFTPTYHYYFNNDTDYTTENIINGGTFTVEITGLNDTTSTAFATVAGETVQLKRNGTSNQYTGTLSHYSLNDFSETASPISFSVRATNGKGEAKEISDALSFDYGKPSAPKYSFVGSSIILSDDANDTSKFYVFKDYIPESTISRETALNQYGVEIPATNGSATGNICQKYDYGVENTLRIIAADGNGVIGSSNLSNATQIKYTSLFKSAHILTHTQDGSSDKTVIGVTYDDTCTQTATQPSTSDDNDGVSLKSLQDNATVRMSFQPIGTENFTTNLAWTAIYELPDGTDVAQIQLVEAYAGKTFFIEYAGELYKGTFPSTQAEADASVDNPIDLETTTNVNTSLVP